jgi:hypothetical protein
MLQSGADGTAPGDEEAPLSEQGPGQGWSGGPAGQGRAQPPPPDATAQHVPPPAGPPPGQAVPPPGQAAPPPAAAAAESATQGFINSLFDFSFTSFVTPKVIKALYALIMIGVGLAVVLFVIVVFRYNAVAGAISLVILGPIYFLVTMAFYRVVLEFFMVTFRIYEELHLIRRQGDRLR